MNRLTGRAVTVVVLSAAVLVTCGCVDVDGGAIELSWEVRDEVTGNNLDCGAAAQAGTAGAKIASVGLCTQDCETIVNGSCEGTVACPVRSWPCERRRGTTLFDVPAGRKALWIEPRCAGDTLAQVSVPEPLVRVVVEGEVTQLNTLLITVLATGDPCPPQ